MLVFRVCKEAEALTVLQEESTANIGTPFTTNKKLNTFEYQPNKKYLHFYRRYEDIFYVNSNEKNYVCIYEIPDELLTPYKGIGYYLDRLFYRKLEYVEEYAIDADLLDFKYLKRVDKIETPIQFEDYVDGDFQITTIYDSEQKKKKLGIN